MEVATGVDWTAVLLSYGPQVGSVLVVVLLFVPVVWRMIGKLSEVPTREDLATGLEGCRATRRDGELVEAQVRVLDSQNRILDAQERLLLETTHQRRILSKQTEILRVIPERIALYQHRASTGGLSAEELHVMEIRVDDADCQIDDLNS